MKHFSKIAVCAAAFASAVIVNAETINIADPAVMRTVLGKATIADNMITHTGKAYVFGKKYFEIDPAKKYTFKYTIENKSDIPFATYVGLNFVDKDGKGYPFWSWQCNTKSATEVIADAKKGDTEIKVKNGASWIISGVTAICKDVAADYSDMPTPANKLVPGYVTKKAKDADGWILTLSAPLKSDIAKGTVIRQHYHSGYYYLPNSTPAKIGAKQSRTFITTISGYAKNSERFNAKNFPIGAKKFHILFLSDYANTKADVVIKDATLTIE